MRERYKEGSARSAKNILSVIEKAKENNELILVFPHRSVDGDCVGSSSGIVSIIRAFGADAYAAIPEELPENMSFLGIGDMLFRPDGDSEAAGEFKADGTIGGKKVGAAIVLWNTSVPTAFTRILNIISAVLLSSRSLPIRITLTTSRD